MQQDSLPRTRPSQKRHRSQSSSQETSFEETFSYDQSEVLVAPPFVRDNGVFQAIGSSSQSQRPTRNTPTASFSRPSSVSSLARSKSLASDIVPSAIIHDSQSKSSFGSQSQPLSYDQTSIYDQSLSRCVHPLTRDPEVLQALGYDSQISHSDCSMHPYSAPVNTTSDETSPRSFFGPALEESLIETDRSITQDLESPSKSSLPPELPSPIPTISDRESSDSLASIPSAFAPSTTPPLPDGPSQTNDFRPRVDSSLVELDVAQPHLSSAPTVPTDINMDESDRIESSAEARSIRKNREEEIDSGVFYEKSFDASGSLERTQQMQTIEWETTPARTQVDTQVNSQNVGMDDQQALSPSKEGNSSKNRASGGVLIDRKVAEDRAKRSLVLLNKRRRIRPPEDGVSNSFSPLYTKQDAPFATFHHALDTPERSEPSPSILSKQTIISSHLRSPGLALTSEDTFVPATSSPSHTDMYFRSNVLEKNLKTSQSSDAEDATNLANHAIHYSSPSGIFSKPLTWPSVLNKSKLPNSSNVEISTRSLPADEVIPTQSTLSSLPPSSIPVPTHDQTTSSIPSILDCSPRNPNANSKSDGEGREQEKEEKKHAFGTILSSKQLVSAQSSELSNLSPPYAASKSQVIQTDQRTLESDSSLSTIPSETESSLSDLLTMEIEPEIKGDQTKDTHGNEDVQVRSTTDINGKETAPCSLPIRTRQQTRKQFRLPRAPIMSSLNNRSRSKQTQGSDRTLPSSQLSEPSTSSRITRSNGQPRFRSKSSNRFVTTTIKPSKGRYSDDGDDDDGEGGRDDTIECADDTIWRTKGFPTTTLCMATAMTTKNEKSSMLSTIPDIKVSRRTRLASNELSRLRRIVANRPSVDELQLQQMFALGRVQRVFGLYKDSGSFWPGMVVEARFFGDYILDWDEENSKPSNISIRDLRKCVLRKGDIVWSILNGAHEFIVAEDYDSSEGIGPDTEISVSFPDHVLEGAMQRKGTLRMRDILIDKLNVSQMDDRKLFTEDMYVREPALLTSRSPATSKTTIPVSSSNPSATGSGTGRVSSPGRNTRRSGGVDDVIRPTKPGCFVGYGFIFTTPTLTEFERTKVQTLIVENGGLVGNDFQNFYSIINSSDSTSIQEELVYRKERKQDELTAVFVLAEQPCRTPKYLKALALGIPCLATSYIQNAVSNGDGWRGYMLSTPFSEHLKTFGSQQFVHPSWSVDRSIVRTMILSTPNYVHRPFTNLTLLYLNPKKTERELVIFLCIALGAKSITTTSDLSDPSLSLIFKSFDILIVKDDLKPFPSKTAVGKKSGRLEIVNEEWVKQCSIVGQQVKRLPWKTTTKK